MRGSKRSSQFCCLWAFSWGELKVGGEAEEGPAGHLPPLGRFLDAAPSQMDRGA